MARCRVTRLTGKTGQQLQFDVIDTGIGIPEELIPKLFGRFTQLDSGANRRFGGEGLGLAISQRLAVLLGGGIEVDSRTGEGSRFRVTVNACPSGPVMIADSLGQASSMARPDESPQKMHDSVLRHARILLAEDGPDNQRLFSFILSRPGANVTIAENGEQAVKEALTPDQDDRPYDAILMDMQMPIMDGYAATKELRRQGYRAPIIAVTAHAIASDRQKCLDAGCDEYLSKPLDHRQLLQVIAQLLTEPVPRPSGTREYPSR